VTVLFADLVGSTPLGEHLDPEALRSVQARFFDALRVAVERHEGTVEKFIGDEVMAVFGIPQLHEDDALRAVRAAFDMQRALDQLNRGLQPRWGVQLAIRTGIHTGAAVAGDANDQALVTGDVVVTAKRLETAATPGEVLVGAETYRLVRHAVRAEPIAPVTAKGKAERVPAWRITGVDPSAGAVPRRLDSPMVGRDRQLRILAEAAERSRVERTPQLVTILGLAGVGKSRLVNEFLQRARSEATIIRGHCLAYGEAISYWPLAEALRAAAGIAPDDPPALAVERLGTLARDVPQSEVIIGRAAAAIGLGRIDGSPASGAQETYWAFRRLFEAMARQRPLIAVFDDLQWATPTFLDLLEHIADWSRDAPIVLLGIARPELLETRPAWGGGKRNALTLFLEPLDARSVAQLLANLAGQLPHELVRVVEDTAEGNPLFVEELVAKLIDDGTLQPGADGYRVTGSPQRLSVPPTIELLLASRLDHLPSEERAILERAAVIGKRCGAAEVAELSPAEKHPVVVDRLMALVRKELLRLDEEAPDIDAIDEDVRFRFRHQLVRDAAYEGLPKYERAHLHEVLAEWMEKKLAERLESLREVIGYHFEQAATYRQEVSGDDEATISLRRRAATHLEAAARRADVIADSVAVLRLLERANQLRGPDDPQRLANLPMLVDALQFAGRLEEARAVREEVLASPAAEPATRADALERIWTAIALGASAAEMRPQVEEALEIRRRLGDAAGIARALLARSELARYVGRLKQMHELATEALDYALGAGDLGLQGRAMSYRTGAFRVSVASEPDRVQSMLEENLAFAREHGQPAMEAVTLRMLGTLKGELGDRSQATEHFARSLEIMHEQGWELDVRGFWGEALLDHWVGDTVRAADRLRTVCRQLAAIGEKGGLSTAATLLAHCLIDLGETQEADGALRTAEESGARDDVVTQVELRAARARLLAQRGALGDAETMAREAVREAEAVEYRDLILHAHLALGDVLRLAGRLDDAAAEWRAMIAFSEARGNLLYAGRLRRELAEVDRQRRIRRRKSD
jgi:class 3 adenylate cyclase